jgi:lysozyme
MSINVVIDISHHNSSPDLAKAKADGVIAVIHKASQGTRSLDPMYKTNRKKALDAGLLWGAYHFGTASDPADQADHFLDAADPDKDTLLVLDFEPDPQGTDMNLRQAREFVDHINQVRGTFPGLYSGHTIKEALGGKPKDDTLSNCFLWLAQYASRPSGIPSATWPTWTFWQYTDGMHGSAGPLSVAGVGHCDRDMFNGSLENLKKLWGVSP